MSNQRIRQQRLTTVYIANDLSDDDMQRAHDVSPKPPPPTLLAGSYLALLEAVNIFTQESVHKLTTTLLNLSAREQAILGLSYRSIGFSYCDRVEIGDTSANADVCGALRHQSSTSIWS